MKIENKEKIEGNDQGQQAVDKSKRSFSKAGVVAPILLSFASRPTWAMENCSFRQAMSGNTSQQGPNPLCDDTVMSARSPGFFVGQPVERWYEDYGVNDDLFSNVFGNAPAVSIGKKKGSTSTITNSTPSFKQIFDASTNALIFEPDEVNAQNARCMHYIAAYLCALSPDLVFPYTVAEIKADWGVWYLFDNLKLIQVDGGMTVRDVADILQITI